MGLNMKTLCMAFLMGIASFSAHAQTVNKAPSLFPDAPPPPQIAKALAASCCTLSGMLVLTPPHAGASITMTEGAACAAKNADGLIQEGSVCY